jgi:exodeoxyribonuclease VII large subunit
MSSLFDLPFEDEPAATGNSAAEPSTRSASSGSTGSGQIIRTVSELTAGIRDLLETAYMDVWVEGEISNCRLWNTGHLYFTLKDPGAQLKAVML